MGFYKSPADMFDAKAERFEKDGKRFWAMAKNGEGDCNYGKAKKKFNEVKANREKAEYARKNNLTFPNKKKTD